MSEFWLVEVPNLETKARAKRWRDIKNLAESLTVLRAITLDTLCTMLMSDEEFAQHMDVLKPKGYSWKGSQAIRGYWKRHRQPELPGLN